MLPRRPPIPRALSLHPTHHPLSRHCLTTSILSHPTRESYSRLGCRSCSRAFGRRVHPHPYRGIDAGRVVSPHAFPHPSTGRSAGPGSVA
ncbi:hypothetical protein BDV93DRAFT_83685 [Ceratobasidium sp. AG-I]|nr:hypothetical protein BDV93DRAFT_83685 [Ceratobasidium sp. AG-I]